MRTYEGKPELLLRSGDWKNLGCWADKEANEGWFIFFKDQQHGNDWATFKVVANGRVPNKANYWFVRNKKNGKIGFSKDLAIMAANRPRLHAHVMKVVSEEA